MFRKSTLSGAVATRGAVATLAPAPSSVRVPAASVVPRIASGLMPNSASRIQPQILSMKCPRCAALIQRGKPPSPDNRIRLSREILFCSATGCAWKSISTIEQIECLFLAREQHGQSVKLKHQQLVSEIKTVIEERRTISTETIVSIDALTNEARIVLESEDFSIGEAIIPNESHHSDEDDIGIASPLLISAPEYDDDF